MFTASGTELSGSVTISASSVIGSYQLTAINLWDGSAGLTVYRRDGTITRHFYTAAPTLPATHSLNLAQGDFSIVPATTPTTPTTPATPVTPDPPVAQPVARASNLSTRMRLPAGETITVGFVVVDGTRSFLIRAIGPTLAAFGVPNVMENPQLTLRKSGTTIASNDDWQQGPNAAAVAASFAKVGAFALTANSKDAATILALAPGTYTAEATSVTGQGGDVMVEVYELP